MISFWSDRKCDRNHKRSRSIGIEMIRIKDRSGSFFLLSFIDFEHILRYSRSLITNFKLNFIISNFKLNFLMSLVFNDPRYVDHLKKTFILFFNFPMVSRSMITNLNSNFKISMSTLVFQMVFKTRFVKNEGR